MGRPGSAGSPRQGGARIRRHPQKALPASRSSKGLRSARGFDEEAAVRLLADAVAIDSPTGEESRLSHYLASVMRERGFSRVKVDEAGSAVGECGRGRTEVLLCGHIDTVPGHLPVFQRDGRLHGRGSVDAKPAACAMLVAATPLLDDPDLHLTVVCATGEEGTSVGIDTLLRKGDEYDYAVFGEPGGAERVTVAYRGRMTLKVALETAGGHAGSAWAHRSAFDEALELVGVLRDYERRMTVEGDHYRSLSVSVTQVTAGESHNVVPRSAKLTFDVRVPPGLSCAEVRTALKGILGDLSARRKLTVEHEFGESTEACESPASSPLVRAFQRGILLRTSGKPVLLKKTGTGDMNTYASARHAPCVTYGAGEGTLSHTDNESVSIHDYLLSIVVLGEALAQLKLLTKRRD